MSAFSLRSMFGWVLWRDLILAWRRRADVLATLWMLDEVLTSLDDAAVRLSLEFMSDHINNGGMAVVATHQDLNLSVERRQRIQLSP